MIRSITCAGGIVCAGCITAAALGQAVNIDFGLNTPPPSSYAAAGLPGVWNSIEGRHSPSLSNPQYVYNLVGLNGQATFVTLYQYGGMELIDVTDPNLTGDAKDLMRDCLVSHSSSLESCLFINGLTNGQYEVISYGWMPNHPESRARVRLDFNPTSIDVGGAWPGGQVEGVTFARHIVNVTSGYIGIHSGNVPGGNLSVGAPLNGVQIRPIIEGVPGDINDDGNVSLIDYDMFRTCMAGPGVTVRPQGCSVDAFDEADLDNDNDVDLADFKRFEVLVH